MHEIETQMVATPTRGSFRLFALAVAACLLMQCACGGGVTAPSAFGGAAPGLSLTGTWRGGSANESLIWRLTQDGDRISGSSSVVDGGGWTGAGGRVVGTLSGLSLEFNESYPVGSLSVAGCSAEFEGILQVETKMLDPAGGIGGAVLPPLAGRLSMTGYVRGRGCGGPSSATVTLYKD